MIISGRAVTYGDDINTDLIIPGRYLHIHDPSALAEHAMEDIDPDFHARFRPGDILVAGRNFGCGSSREQAAICLKYAGVEAIVAGSFARIFFRNAVNLGIALVVCDTSHIKNDDQLEIDPEKGSINDITQGITLQGERLPPFLLEIIRDGGLIPHLKKTL